MPLQRINNKKTIEQTDGKNVSFDTVKRLWMELSNKKGLLICVLLLVLINALLGIAGPFLIGKAIDQFIYEKVSSGLIPLLVGLASVYFFYSLTTFLQNYWMIGIAQETVFSMRKRLFEHFQSLPISFFDKRQHGELMSRVTNDMDNVSSTLNSSVIQVFSSVLTLLGTISVMVYLSPLLTLITLIIVPLMFYGMKWITKRTSKLFKKQQRYLGDLNGFIEETVSGQKIIKTFSQESYVMDEFLEKSTNLRKAGYWAQTYSGFIPKLMNMLNNLGFAIIAFAGGIFAIHDIVTIGVMVAFTEYARQFTRPLNDLANQFNTLLSAIAGAERVFDILDMNIEENDEADASDVNAFKGKVEFTNVSFSYEKDGNTITDANFLVSPGETVALVGPTGAGKSTIINLLSRFYEPNQGTITIDGISIQQMTRKSLRRAMGFVLQDVFLFEGTIRENIRYGRLNATDEEVIEAAKQANAHKFISRLPNGYDTMLSQDGSGISQGQKQLLSIARAILRDPSILILDEATSNIDTVTEIKIQEALQRLMKNRTTFVIAHRLNTIQHANQILVLQAGKIIEKGNHETLLTKRGFYFSLYNNGEKEVG
ncbi:ABC transporter ATP-binding protein/permease [Caldibacillus lycopersici]|uniref:ABC transporter ATP-binding protein/permease n=1 Tax=Perspicuibacillus lycopersici TaxID=1325689 RepID=A0AAE3ISF9_9BACI|nr:ABC transporter ATP-binding protein [Perspicuibacillus lycopersici]MCU9613567.1 ABC transporter ATP-binding protein/permease [Perspicuibacillus lycopersici]